MLKPSLDNPALPVERTEELGLENEAMSPPDLHCDNEDTNTASAKQDDSQVEISGKENQSTSKNLELTLSCETGQPTSVNTKF